LSPYPGGFAECTCLVLPQCRRPSPCGNVDRLPASFREHDFSRDAFEAAAISLCSGLTVCSPHRSFPPLQLSPQGGRGFYVRAERASLPPHASEMLSARLQAIGGTRTLTSQDSQHCRLLIPHAGFSGASRTASTVCRILGQVDCFRLADDPWGVLTIPPFDQRKE